jgi:hypothetical protein
MKKKITLLMMSLLIITDITMAMCPEFNAHAIVCGKRGKRGHRGPRGHHGKRGHTGSASSCGVNELFINALMMSWTGEETFPPNALFFPYLTTGIFAWNLLNPIQFPNVAPVGASFNIPNDLDNTKPVNVVIHMFVASDIVIGNQAKIQVQMDYQPNNGILGVVPPATGYADTQVSADFTVTPPDASSTNLRQVSVSIPLDPTKMQSGDWAFIGVTRIAAATNEFSDPLCLTTISFQYNRICS